MKNNIKKTKKTHKKNGQSIAEYLILFCVVLGVVIAATTAFIGPSLNGLYERTSRVINEINPTLINDD
jgi:uncharacterized protein (UPF0333 family)